MNCSPTSDQAAGLFPDSSSARAVWRDDVQSLSHIQVGLAAPNLAELEVAKRNQASEKEPP